MKLTTVLGDIVGEAATFYKSDRLIRFSSWFPLISVPNDQINHSHTRLPRPQNWPYPFAKTDVTIFANGNGQRLRQTTFFSSAFSVLVGGDAHGAHSHSFYTQVLDFIYCSTVRCCIASIRRID